MIEDLEVRMYGLVPYNISPIQQAIQFGHAVVDYGQKVKGLKDKEALYDNWANNYKTFIILNGGTTNNNSFDKLGTLNKHFVTLAQNNIDIEIFSEPDLGDQLTAVVFLVDERVFDRVKYPDYQPLIFEDELFYLYSNHHGEEEMNYRDWVKSVGGEKNVFLRDFLKQFRLA